MRCSAWVIAAGVLAAGRFAPSSQAGPPAPVLGEVLRGLSVRVERMGVGPTGHATGVPGRRLASAHLELTSLGRPLRADELAVRTAALRDAVEALGTPDLVQVELDLFGPDRIGSLMGSVSPNHVRRNLEEPGRGTVRWIVDAQAVDTTHPVGWYARVVWWRPYLCAGRTLTGIEDWRVTVWYAAENASARAAEGASWHAPALLR